MKVRALIAILEKMDPERVVILQKDAEGNGYSPLEGADDNCLYAADSTWSGEVGHERLTEKDRKQGYTDEDIGHGEKAVVLFPVN